MSFLQFKEPKCKRKLDSSVKPLPIPIEIIDEHFTAYVSDSRVFVKDLVQAGYLYKHGCFGKGEFSRGNPCFNSNVTDVVKQDYDVDVSLALKNMTLVSDDRYNRRKEWGTRMADGVEDSESFHGRFLKEFLGKKAQMLNFNDVNRKPKCRVEFKETGEQQLNTIVNRNLVLAPPNFDPFVYIVKDIPNCIISECSYLMLEEAFFLAYALGCLKVYNDSKELKISELWQQFSKLDKNFVNKYIVYHKLRSKGWILRNGMKYGCDFLAYYKGPEYYHASYSIIVKSSHDDDNDNESLATFAGLIRVNENASKEIMVCYVAFNDEADSNTPLCIRKSSVYEIIINRWVPEQNRVEASNSNKK